MRRSILTSLLVLCLVAAPAWAQPSPGELTVILSS